MNELKESSIISAKVGKVLIYISSFPAGGVPYVYLTLAFEYKKMGMRVVFVVNDRSGSLLNLVSQSFEVLELPKIKLRSRVFILRKIIKKENPDVFLVGSWPNTLSASISMLGIRLNKGVVLTEHTDFATTPGLTSKDRKLLRFLGPIVYRRSLKVSCVSEGVAQSLISVARLKIKPNVIYNPVRFDLCANDGSSPGFRRTNNNRFKILAVGNLYLEKGYCYLLSAARILMGQGYDLELRIVGDGPRKSDLIAKVEDFSLQGRVTIHSGVTAVDEFYRWADVFVLSSVNEGFGSVLVEALYFGKKIVSTDCHSGPREILSDGQYGKLVSVRSAEALAEGIEEAFHSEADTRALKKRAADFSPSKIAAQYLGLVSL